MDRVTLKQRFESRDVVAMGCLDEGNSKYSQWRHRVERRTTEDCSRGRFEIGLCLLEIIKIKGENKEEKEADIG